MSYFYFLHKDTVFEVLVRMHYSDLQNFKLSYPNVCAMTETTYFINKWNAYNLRLETHTTQKCRIAGHPPVAYVWEVQMDRLRNLHGKGHKYILETYATNKQMVTSEEYVQNKYHGTYIEYGQVYKTLNHEYTYDNGQVTKYITSGKDNHVYSTTYGSHNDHGRHGLHRHYYDDGRIHWLEFKNGKFDGVSICWHPNGSREEVTWNNRTTYMQYEWNEEGQLIYVNGVEK